jgi:hypothetical protein
MEPEKEAAYILGGTAIVEAGPGIVEDVFGDMGFGYDNIAGSPIGESIESAVDWTQNITPAIATLALGWLAFRMVLGMSGDNKKRSRHAS